MGVPGVIIIGQINWTQKGIASACPFNNQDDTLQHEVNTDQFCLLAAGSGFICLCRSQANITMKRFLFAPSISIFYFFIYISHCGSTLAVWREEWNIQHKVQSVVHLTRQFVLKTMKRLAKIQNVHGVQPVYLGGTAFNDLGAMRWPDVGRQAGEAETVMKWRWASPGIVAGFRLEWKRDNGGISAKPPSVIVFSHLSMS